MKKRLLFAAVILLFGLRTQAQPNGTTGPLTWSIVDSVLTISGTGAMPHYNSNASPWHAYRYYMNKVVIEEGVTSIGNHAFSNCGNLALVNIPSTVDSIGKWAFFFANGLVTINVAADNSSYSSQDGVLFNKAKTELTFYPRLKPGMAYTVPNTVVTIKEYAFYSQGILTSITLPNSLNTIGEYAFNSCIGLTSIIIPHGVVTIKNATFSACSTLTSVVIPNSVTAIEQHAFQNCVSLASFTVQNLNPGNITLASAVFDHVATSNCSLYVPVSAVPAYETANHWMNFNIVGKGYLIVANSEQAQGSTTGSGLYESGAAASLTATPNTGYLFEKWTNNGVTISTGNPYTFTVTQDRAIVAHFKIEGTSIEGVGEPVAAVALYPNPTFDELFLYGEIGNFQRMELYDLSGRKLTETTHYSLNLASYAAGSYLVKIYFKEGKTVTRKVIKTNRE